MTREQFDILDDYDKKIAIFEAEKVCERSDELIKYELFKIDNFFVEARTSTMHRFKRNINSYNIKDLPLTYAAIVFAMLDN